MSKPCACHCRYCKRELDERQCMVEYRRNSKEVRHICQFCYSEREQAWMKIRRSGPLKAPVTKEGK